MLALAFRRELGFKARIQRPIKWNRVAVIGIALLGPASIAGMTWNIHQRERALQSTLKAGRAALISGRYDEAPRCFNQAIDERPDSFEAIVGQADALRARGRMREAIAGYRQAREIRPSPEALAREAYCHAILHEHLEAVDCGLEAIQQGANSAAILNNVGYSLRHLRRYAEARRCLTLALNDSPRLQQPYLNRALVDLELARYDPNHRPQQGCRDIEVALLIGPDAAEFYLTAATLHAIDVRSDKASVSKALHYLTVAVELGLGKGEFEHNPDFRALEAEPMFQALLAKPQRAHRQNINAVYLVKP